MSANEHSAAEQPHAAAARYQDQWESHAYWKARSAALRAACRPGIPGLFKGMVGVRWSPIEAGIQDQILSYLNDPNLESWLAMRSSMITPVTTLWQAWQMVDPSAPSRGVSGPCPPPQTLVRGMRSAVDAEREYVSRMLLENPHPGPRMWLVK